MIDSNHYPSPRELFRNPIWTPLCGSQRALRSLRLSFRGTQSCYAKHAEHRGVLTIQIKTPTMPDDSLSSVVPGGDRGEIDCAIVRIDGKQRLNETSRFFAKRLSQASKVRRLPSCEIST